MKSIGKVAVIGTKILEVFHWVGAVLMAAAAVCSVVAPAYIGYFVGFDARECCGAELEVYGFEVWAAVTDGAVDLTAFLLFGLGAVMILVLMAMVFRNLHLIFRNSENATPFQLENIRRMKEIGVFSIAVPVVGFIMSVLIRLIIGVENAEIRIDLGGIFMGVIVFCLTQYFAHGAKLEQDVDGLL